MNRLNPENFENRQLGSLAREAEQLRLRQSHSADSVLLPAPVQDSEQAAVATAEASEFSKPPNLEVPRPTQYQALPYGRWLVLILIVVAVFGGTVESARVDVLSRIVDAVGIDRNPELYILNKIDLANSQSAGIGGFPQAVRKYNELITQLTNKYGAADQRTCYVQMSLAKQYIDHGDEPSARKIWQEQMKYLDAPQSQAPRDLTETLLKLAEHYAPQDILSARILYLATIRFWPHAPGCNTLSNVEQDLASVDLPLGRVAEANQQYKNALAISLSWGNADYNVYRLREVARTDLMLKRFADAIPYAEKSLKMATVMYGRKNSGYDLYLLGTAKAGAGQAHGAIADLTEAIRLLKQEDSSQVSYFSYAEAALKSAIKMNQLNHPTGAGTGTGSGSGTGTGTGTGTGSDTDTGTGSDTGTDNSQRSGLE